MAQESLREKVKEMCTLLWQEGCILSDVVREVEKQFILKVINESKGNSCLAARELGVHRNTLSRKLYSLGIFRVRGKTRVFYLSN